MSGNEDTRRKSKKVGRPRKYDYETLEKILLKYAAENIGGKIKITNLVKYSGIPIQAWRFNKEIQKKILGLNTPQSIIFSDSIDIGLPSAEDLINKNYKNRDNLTKVVSDLIEVCQCSYAEIVKLKKYKKQLVELNREIELLKKENDNRQKEVEFYKNEVMKLTLRTTTAIGRSESGIEENIIDLKKYSETTTTFSNLFDD